VAGAVVAALGIVMVLIGAWIVVYLGPSGEASFSADSKGPGAVVIPANVLNAVDLPVRITAIRPAGGSVNVLAGPSNDVRAVLSGSAVSTVTGVRYPAGSLKLRGSGLGAPPDISTADVWRLVARGVGSAELVVDQGTARGDDPGISSGNDPGRSPETAVVTTGDSTPLGEVNVTLTWVDQAWFFKALVLAMFGAVVAAFALNDLWQGRAMALARDAAESPTAAVTV
jgi:hypothetical protein